MKSKLLVFVVLATLGQSAFAQRSTSCCVLSEKERGVLSKLRAAHDATNSLAEEVNHSLYDYIQELVVRYLNDLKPKTSDDNKFAAIFAELKRKDRMRFSRMLDAISIAVKKRCNNLEPTRTTINANLDAAYASIILEVELAQNGKHSERRVPSLLATAGGLVRGFYNLLRDCGKINDANILAVIATAENRSLTGIYHEATSVFESLRIFAVAVASRNKDRTLIQKVYAPLSRGLPGAKADTNNRAASLEAFYLYSLCNRRGTMRGLFSIRYAAIVTPVIYKEILKTISGEIVDLSNDGSSQLLKEPKEVLSRTDLAKAKTAALYENANAALMEVCLFLRPRNSGEVKHVQKNLNALTYKMTGNIFEMIEVATDKDKSHSQIMAEIHTLENELVHLCWGYNERLINVIRGGKDSSEENHYEPKIIENTFLAVNALARIIPDGVIIAANAVHKNGAASTNAISALQDFEKGGEVAVVNYIESIASVCCVALMNSYES